MPHESKRAASLHTRDRNAGHRMPKRLLTASISALFCFNPLPAYAQEFPDLKASIGLLPGLADSPERGSFIDLIKAMDEIYPGRIIIEVYPIARSIYNIVSGKADFHLPLLRNPVIPEEDLPWTCVDIPMGKLVMVIYSNTEKKIAREDLYRALERGGVFPYSLEIAMGMAGNFAFPATGNVSVESALRKVAAGRIDAFVQAQEEADTVLRELKLKNIYRSFFDEYEDVIMIPRSPRGEEVNRILSEILTRLGESGRLEELYRNIHLSYDDWQPADTW